MPEKKPKTDREASIIAIIQEMVEANEPEEKIISTLRQLGVEPEKAKRLLLLGQADTFALLKGEISRIVRDELENQKDFISRAVEEKSEEQGGKSFSKVQKSAQEEIEKLRLETKRENDNFRQKIEETAMKTTELSDKVRNKLNDLGEVVANTQQDIDEMKLRGVGSRNKLISYLLILGGIIFSSAALFFLIVKFQGRLDVDSLIVTTITAAIGVTMLFVSTLV
ncbi:MAG: hypothetical protein HY394_06380 [Candidatus Diapherotrites archaeon]|nr:hypothetical protein [Candidatus Diapherotrites archaeon]